MATPKFVQILANRMSDGYVIPAQHRDEVAFCSVYLGEPGSYQWMADFAQPEEANYFAYRLASSFDNCKVDHSQYDEVMSTPAPE